MNRLTLRFKDPALEKQYEQSQFEMYRTKSNYYFQLSFSNLCSLVHFRMAILFIRNWTCLEINQYRLDSIYFNFLCKYPQFGKEAIFFENLILISSKLQHLYSHMGHDDDKITDLITLTDLEYHLHILQVFDVGCFQIVLQSANNIFMEYFIGTRVNIFQIVNNILCASIKMIVINLLSLKDQIWQQQLPNIIQKPFFKFTLENFTKQFRSILSNQIEMFPSYDPNFCEGCNLRSFLRFCIRDKKTLEQKLLDDYIHKEQIQGKNNEEVWYSNNLKHYSIRICNLNVERFKCLIILEEYKHKEKQSISNNLIKKQLLRSISSRSNHITNKFFKLGMYTIFSINNEQIGLVNMYILLKRLSTYYSFWTQNCYLSKVRIISRFLQKHTVKIVSFMVCIFNIFIKIQTSKIKKIFLKIEILDWDTICIQTEGVDHKVFLEEYKMNLYLVQVEQQLLVFPVSDSLRFVFQSQKDKEPLEMKYLKMNIDFFH